MIFFFSGIFLPYAVRAQEEIVVKSFSEQLETGIEREQAKASQSLEIVEDIDKPSPPPRPPADPMKASQPNGARCFTVINKAPYSIHGSFYTNFYMTSSGTPGRHQSNFRLGIGDRSEFCSYGPFLGANKDHLYLVLRTLIPIFSCQFKAEDELIIFGRRKAEGGTETWGSCLK